MAKVFITGATGQVGSHLAEYLAGSLKGRKEVGGSGKPRYDDPVGIPGLPGLESEKDILCLVRPRRRVTRKDTVERISEKASVPVASVPVGSVPVGIPSGRGVALLEKLGVKIITGDLSDRDLLFEVLRKVDYVFHLAANVYVYSSFDDMYRANVEGTKNLLDAFVASKGRLFVHTSSIIVYDTSKKAFKLCGSRERAVKTFGNIGAEKIFDFREDCPWGPVERGKDIPYAVTKRLGERLVLKYAAQYAERYGAGYGGLGRQNAKQGKTGQKLFVITRLGPVVGSRDRQMIPALVESMRVPLPRLVGGGRTRISLTAPKDVARAQVFLALKLLKGEISSGEVFNIANEMVSFRELFSFVAEYYERKPPSFSIPRWIFRLVKPLLKFARRFVPHNMFIQTFFSPSALEYLEKSYSYNSDKLRSLGFRFAVPIRESVLEGLRELDPEKKMLLK